MSALSGKVGLITGAGSGLGLATARLLSTRGAAVVITELPSLMDQARAAVDAIGGSGGRAVAVPVDVRQSGQLEGAVERAVEAFGSLDIMVCNAGTSVRKPALEMTDEEWDRVIHVNLSGVFFSMRAAAAQMVRQSRGGKIITVASIFGLVGSADRAGYCASKAGVVNLTRALAVEWAPHNIQVNGVAPTFVRTPLTEALFNDQHVLHTTLDRTPNRRLATPEDVAEAVAFLASPAADMVTGVVLPVDGGWTAQ